MIDKTPLTRNQIAKLLAQLFGNDDDFRQHYLDSEYPTFLEVFDNYQNNRAAFLKKLGIEEDKNNPGIYYKIQSKNDTKF